MNDSSLIGLWSGDTWREVDFIDLNIGYFYSYRENPEKLYKTTNGGKDWIALNKNLGCQIIKFYNEDIGILKSGICSDTACYSQIYRTIDGGLTWKAVGTDSLDLGLDIEFIPNNPAKVWLLAGNKVLFSNDTGKTWNEEIYKPDFHTRSGFIDIEFTDSNHGWLIGREQTLPFRQHLYKTVNGGHGGIMNIKAASRLIHDYYLSNNYPNPFNPSTKITFRIPTAEHVEMTVYDLLGREVATLVNGFKNAGNYTVDFYASKLASGVYLYRIKSGDFILSKKMVLLK